MVHIGRRARVDDLLTLTPWSDDLKGVFSTRSPRRPNPIGIKPYVVKLNPDT